MKIYFSASRYYKEEYKENYEKIMKVLEEDGSTVMDLTKGKLVPLGFEMPDAEKKTIYSNLVKMMDRADICVFEASYPSTLHIGHEITLALEKSKPVIVLYTHAREPILFKGMTNDKVIWIEYNDQNLEEKLLESIEEQKHNVDVRFNFFVSPKILAYLDWVAKNRKVPRSVFLRNLIEKEMKKDRGFN